MLYREPQLSAASVLRAVLARFVGAIAAFHRTGTDTAYMDSLSDHHLRDLGLRRFDERGETFYR